MNENNRILYPFSFANMSVFSFWVRFVYFFFVHLSGIRRFEVMQNERQLSLPRFNGFSLMLKCRLKRWMQRHANAILLNNIFGTLVLESQVANNFMGKYRLLFVFVFFSDSDAFISFRFRCWKLISLHVLRKVGIHMWILQIFHFLSSSLSCPLSPFLSACMSRCIQNYKPTMNKTNKFYAAVLQQ